MGRKYPIGTIIRKNAMNRSIDEEVGYLTVIDNNDYHAESNRKYVSDYILEHCGSKDPVTGIGMRVKLSHDWVESCMEEASEAELILFLGNDE